MYFKRSNEVRIGQKYFTSYHTFYRTKTLLVLAFPWYKKCWRAPLGAVNFLYCPKIREQIEFLFERKFMYAWNRERFSMIWFCIWFKFNIIGLTMTCAYITIKKSFILLQQCVQLIFFLKIKMSGALCNGFNIGFRIFSIEDALHSFCFSIQGCVVL